MQIREELAKYCNKVYQSGFVAAYDGNLSARISENRILITPSAKSKGEIEPQDFLEIDLNGNLVNGIGKISTENKIHLLVYKRRKEINSVIHAHPTFATIIASSQVEVNQPILPEVLLTIGKIAKCEYATPSTEELPKTMLPFIDFANAFLLSNHGAVTISTSIKDAFYKMEKLEHFAKILFHLELLNKKTLISEQKIQELYAIAESTYNIKINENNRF